MVKTIGKYLYFVKFSFIIFLVLFCLGETIRFDLGNNFIIKPLDIIVFILVLIWMTLSFKSWKEIIFKDSLFLPIILFVSSAFIALAFNANNFREQEILIGLSYLLRWVLFVFLYFIVKNFSSKFKTKILYMLFVVGLVITFFGFLQYFLYSDLRNLYYLGWDEHMHRMFSVFLDPNFASAFFVLFLIFLLGIFLYFLKIRQIKYVFAIGLILVFSLISILLTYSRSGLIMLLFSIAIFSVLAKKFKFIFLIFIILFLYILVLSKNINSENTNLFRIASVAARIDSAKVAIEIIKENLFLGVGFNTYRYAQIKYGYKNPVSRIINHADAGTDNSFLFVLSTTGVIGLLFYLNLLWNIFKKSYSNFKKHNETSIQKYISIIVIASIGGIIIDSLFINSLFYSFIMIWTWILLGLMENN